MKKITLTTVAVLLMAGTAWAACDVELAFNPTSVAAGDQVTMFASVANLGDADTLAQVDVSVSFNSFTLGPIGGRLPLAAGQTLSRETTFTVPPLPNPGTLTVTVTVTCDGSSDTATASLTYTGGANAAGTDGVGTFGREVLTGLTADSALADEPATFGAVKALYR